MRFCAGKAKPCSAGALDFSTLDLCDIVLLAGLAIVGNTPDPVKLIVVVAAVAAVTVASLTLALTYFLNSVVP